ncbi:MAG: NAD(P)-dependent alcohol dehydrogenase, partial [Opitutaceae bacterium]|nr:NAD(P)-dependent alcohol dehydrogenase [Opitutaceae bacterium]
MSKPRTYSSKAYSVASATTPFKPDTIQRREPGDLDI